MRRVIYGKLPVAFLGAIASEKNGSTNSVVAAYILEHLDQVRGMGVTELARACHVSASSISRFCKDIGFDSYAELREVFETSRLEFQQAGVGDTAAQRAQQVAQAICRGVSLVGDTLDMEKVRQLCGEIHRSARVAAFGLLKAEAAAVDLQCDLLMLGKQVYTNVSYPQQMEYLLTAGREDLVVLFSCTGAYFEYTDQRGLGERLRAPRIWMICGERREHPSWVDQVLEYQSCGAQAGHPYQLQTAASILAGEYAALFHREEKAPKPQKGK